MMKMNLLLRRMAFILMLLMLFTAINISVAATEPIFADEETENPGDGTEGENNEDGEFGEEEEDIPPSEIDFTVDTDGGFEKVASTKYLDLYFDREEIAIRLDMKDENGNVVKKWRSQLSPKNFRDHSKLSQFDKDSMSFLKIKYVNLNKPDSQPVWVTTYEAKPLLLDLKNTGSGISFVLDFKEINIRIPVIIEIVEDEMNVRIPKENFYENIKGVEEVTRAKNIIQEGLNELELLSRRLRDDIERTKNVGDQMEILRKQMTSERLKKLYQDILKFSDSIINESYSSVNIVTLNTLVDDLIKFLPSDYKDRGERIKELMDICAEQFDYLRNNISYGVLEMYVMPYFGFGTHDTNGYVFYPDGSGAISYYNVTRPNNIGRFDTYVYYNHTINMNELNWGQGMAYAQMPVWGVKQDDYGFVSIITEGDYDSKILYIPNTSSYPISRVFSSVIYRRQVRLINNRGATWEAYETSRLDYDRNIKYIFLRGEDADYSGMARTYRNYLKENGALNQVIKEGEKLPFAVDFLMAVKPMSDILVRRTIPMTTYQEALDTLKKFREHGINGKIYSNLRGWTKAAAYEAWPDPLKPNKDLGGLEKLKELTAYARENNIELALEIDPIRGLNVTIPRSDVARHVVKSTVNTPITSNTNNSRVWYMYSPGYIQKRFEEKQLQILMEYGANAVGLSSLGQILYYDYNKDFGGTRAETANRFIEVTKLANEKLGSNSIDMGNAYMLKYAGRINYAPLKDSGYFFADETVPFYQMVLHGSIPYSGEPYNLMYDKEIQKLQFIENGCMPYFFLTQLSPTEMKYSRAMNWEGLYSSEIDHWFGVAVDLYKELDANLSHLWDKTMDKHEVLSEGIKRVTYSDGSKIYFNYTNEQVEVDGITLEPVSYQVVRGGAN